MNGTQQTRTFERGGFPQELIALAVAIPVIGLLVFLGFARNANPVIVTPQRAPVPVQNGFDGLKAAAAKVVRSDDVADAIATKQKHAWSLAEKEKLVADNADALADARRALSYPYLEIHDLMPYYAEVPWLTRLFCLDSDVAEHENKPKLAAQDICDAISVGENIPNGSCLTGRFIGINCASIGRRHLWKQAASMNADTATYCLARLQALQSHHVSLATTLSEEKYSEQIAALEVMKHPEMMDDLTGGTGEEQAKWEKTAAAWVYVTVVSRKGVIKTIGNYMDMAIAQSKQPYPVAKRPIVQPTELIASVAVPEWDPLLCKDTESDTDDALLRTTLALRVYQARHGDYPTDLSAIVTDGLLQALPGDPFAMTQPLKYRRVSSSKYVLYSIGPDGKDDNGKSIDLTKNSYGIVTHTITKDSVGDITAGWYTYCPTD